MASGTQYPDDSYIRLLGVDSADAVTRVRIRLQLRREDGSTRWVRATLLRPRPRDDYV